MPRPHSVPAFLSGVSGAAEMDSAARGCDFSVSAGTGAARSATGVRVRILEDGRAAARSALDARPHVAGFSMRDVRGGRVGAGVPASPRRRSGGAAATDLAAQRRAGGGAAVRVDLCGAVRDGRRAESRDEAGGAVAAADSAHVGLRDSAVPADGRRPDFPGRLCIHARDARGAGDFLHADFRGEQRGRSERNDDGRADSDRGVSVPADSQLDSGAARPVLLLQRPL